MYPWGVARRKIVPQFDATARPRKRHNGARRVCALCEVLTFVVYLFSDCPAFLSCQVLRRKIDGRHIIKRWLLRLRLRVWLVERNDRNAARHYRGL